MANEPRGDRASLAIKALRAVPNAKKRLLNQVLRGASIGDHSQNQTVNHLPVPIVEFRQRLRITLLQAYQEFAIGLRQDCQQKCKHAKGPKAGRSMDYS